jgi:hypothetical protein
MYVCDHCVRRLSAGLDPFRPADNRLTSDSHCELRFRSITVLSSFRQNGLCSHCPACSFTFQNSTCLAPRIIVGDEAFLLKTYLMRPYPGSQSKGDNEKGIFNYLFS